MTIRAREGDLIENAGRVIFDVKGLVHPRDRIVAFPRFIPDPTGNRRHRNTLYGKIYSLSERYRFLEQNLPQYLIHDSVFDETLCEIPVCDAKKHYEPVERLRQLRSSKKLNRLESQALRMTELLKEAANIPWNAIGVSGSILVGLHTENSDIDPIVYGSHDCLKVHSVLKSLLNDEHGPLKPYTCEDLKTLFGFRSKDTAVSFSDFVRTESRKVMQGKFMGTDYFIRFVKDRNEIDETYGDVRYKNIGYARIKATIMDNSEAIFTPCKYEIENLSVIEGPKLAPIFEIASFRGRFCEQAKIGETVIAQGKVEQVEDVRKRNEYFRLLIGNKPSDYMLPEC
jgi:predicted nucleotidyltransferase